MRAPGAVGRSALASIEWPAILGRSAASALALQWQLDRSQWWAFADLETAQREQCRLVFEHAWRSVPWYQQRVEASRAAMLGSDGFTTLPILERAALSDQLWSADPPAEHGAVARVAAQHDDGSAIAIRMTELCGFLRNAIWLRAHLWHQRDLDGRAGVLQPVDPDLELTGWGSAAEAVFATGGTAVLSQDAALARQAEWLADERIVYLFGPPGPIDRLARYCRGVGSRLRSLRGVTSVGAVPAPEADAHCRGAWGVTLSVAYQVSELGCLALTCPEAGALHVQSERVLVEIVNARGEPCRAGELGRMLVSDLHNFAMPMLRYAVGPRAAFGSACSCGRGLPVLARVEPDRVH